MRKNCFFINVDEFVKWYVFLQFWFYFLEFKYCVFFVLFCLVVVKFVSIGLFYVLKYIVDSLNGDLIMFVLVVFISFIVVYGILCLLNVLFGEVCDMLFGWVIECVMCCFGLKVFKYLYNLDLGFYLN